MKYFLGLLCVSMIGCNYIERFDQAAKDFCSCHNGVNTATLFSNGSSVVVCNDGSKTEGTSSPVYSYRSCEK